MACTLMAISSMRPSLGWPVLGEYGSDARIGFDSLQHCMQIGTRRSDVRARPRPFRHDGGVQVERADALAGQEWPCREQVGEHFPVLVQRGASAGAHALRQRLVVTQVLS